MTSVHLVAVYSNGAFVTTDDITPDQPTWPEPLVAVIISQSDTHSNSTSDDVTAVHLVATFLVYDGTKTNYAAAATAIAWRHSVACLPSPTKLPRVIALMSGAKRMLSQPIVRKAALPVSLLRHYWLTIHLIFSLFRRSRVYCFALIFTF